MTTTRRTTRRSSRASSHNPDTDNEGEPRATSISHVGDDNDATDDDDADDDNNAAAASAAEDDGDDEPEADAEEEEEQQQQQQQQEEDEQSKGAVATPRSQGGSRKSVTTRSTRKRGKGSDTEDTQEPPSRRKRRKKTDRETSISNKSVNKKKTTETGQSEYDTNSMSERHDDDVDDGEEEEEKLEGSRDTGKEEERKVAVTKKKKKAKDRKVQDTDDDSGNSAGDEGESETATKRADTSSRRRKGGKVPEIATSASDEESQRSHDTETSINRKPRKRSTRQTKSAKVSVGQWSASSTRASHTGSGAEKSTKRRKSTRTKGTEASQESEGGTEEERPTRRSRRTRKTRKSADESSAQGEGIEEADKKPAKRTQMKRRLSNKAGKEEESEDSDEGTKSTHSNEASATDEDVRVPRPIEAGEIDPGNIITDKRRKGRKNVVYGINKTALSKSIEGTSEKSRRGSAAKKDNEEEAREQHTGTVPKKTKRKTEGGKKRVSRDDESSGSKNAKKDSSKGEAMRKATTGGSKVFTKSTKRTSDAGKKNLKERKSTEKSSKKDTKDVADRFEAEYLTLECTEELELGSNPDDHHDESESEGDESKGVSKIDSNENIVKEKPSTRKIITNKYDSGDEGSPEATERVEMPPASKRGKTKAAKKDDVGEDDASDVMPIRMTAEGDITSKGNPETGLLVPCSTDLKTDLGKTEVKPSACPATDKRTRTPARIQGSLEAEKTSDFSSDSEKVFGPDASDGNQDGDESKGKVLSSHSMKDTTRTTHKGPEARISSNDARAAKKQTADELATYDKREGVESGGSATNVEREKSIPNEIMRAKETEVSVASESESRVKSTSQSENNLPPEKEKQVTVEENEESFTRDHGSSTILSISKSKEGLDKTNEKAEVKHTKRLSESPRKAPMGSNFNDKATREKAEPSERSQKVIPTTVVNTTSTNIGAVQSEKSGNISKGGMTQTKGAKEPVKMTNVKGSSFTKSANITKSANTRRVDIERDRPFEGGSPVSEAFPGPTKAIEITSVERSDKMESKGDKVEEEISETSPETKVATTHNETSPEDIISKDSRTKAVELDGSLPRKVAKEAHDKDKLTAGKGEKSTNEFEDSIDLSVAKAAPDDNENKSQDENSIDAEKVIESNHSLEGDAQTEGCGRSGAPERRNTGDFIDGIPTHSRVYTETQPSVVRVALSSSAVHTDTTTNVHAKTDESKDQGLPQNPAQDKAQSDQLSGVLNADKTGIQKENEKRKERADDNEGPAVEGNNASGAESTTSGPWKETIQGAEPPNTSSVSHMVTGLVAQNNDGAERVTVSETNGKAFALTQKSDPGEKPEIIEGGMSKETATTFDALDSVDENIQGTSKNAPSIEYNQANHKSFSLSGKRQSKSSSKQRANTALDTLLIDRSPGHTKALVDVGGLTQAKHEADVDLASTSIQEPGSSGTSFAARMSSLLASMLVPKAAATDNETPNSDETRGFPVAGANSANDRDRVDPHGKDLEKDSGLKRKANEVIHERGESAVSQCSTSIDVKASTTLHSSTREKIGEGARAKDTHQVEIGESKIPGRVIHANSSLSARAIPAGKSATTMPSYEAGNLADVGGFKSNTSQNTSSLGTKGPSDAIRSDGSLASEDPSKSPDAFPPFSSPPCDTSKVTSSFTGQIQTEITPETEISELPLQKEKESNTKPLSVMLEKARSFEADELTQKEAPGAGGVGPLRNTAGTEPLVVSNVADATIASRQENIFKNAYKPTEDEYSATGIGGLGETDGSATAPGQIEKNSVRDEAHTYSPDDKPKVPEGLTTNAEPMPFISNIPKEQKFAELTPKESDKDVLHNPGDKQEGTTATAEISVVARDKSTEAVGEEKEIKSVVKEDETGTYDESGDKSSRTFLDPKVSALRDEKVINMFSLGRPVADSIGDQNDAEADRKSTGNLPTPTEGLTKNFEPNSKPSVASKGSCDIAQENTEITAEVAKINEMETHGVIWNKSIHSVSEDAIRGSPEVEATGVSGLKSIALGEGTESSHKMRVSKVSTTAGPDDRTVEPTTDDALAGSFPARPCSTDPPKGGFDTTGRHAVHHSDMSSFGSKVEVNVLEEADGRMKAGLLVQLKPFKDTPTCGSVVEVGEGGAVTDSRKRRPSSYDLESKENKRAKANPQYRLSFPVQLEVYRKASHQSPKQKLENLKCRIMKEAKTVHGPNGSERLFATYWSHLANQVVENSSNTDASSTFKTFLKTRKLKKLHNLLVFALLKRSYATSQLKEDTNECIPDHLRKKVKAYMRKSAELVSHQESNRTTLNVDISRKPILALYPTMDLRQRPQNKLKTGLRIPGALSIDPKIRHTAAKEGLTPSDNAIWLLVIAAREYAATILKSCTEVKRSAITGKHTRVPLPRPHTLSYKPKPGEASRKANPTPKAIQVPRTSGPSGPLHITAFDIHNLITQLPMGAPGSLAGTVSRQSFETTLLHSVDTGSSLDVGEEFDSLRRFIASRINVRTEQATNLAAKTPGTQEDRKSPHGGLGRGAKDLASLRARATFTSKNEAESSADRSDSGSHEEKASGQNTGSEGTPVPAEEQQEGDAQSGGRRGKGSGVKNLRAMLARNKPLDSGECAGGEAEESSGQTMSTKTLQAKK